MNINEAKNKDSSVYMLSQGSRDGWSEDEEQILFNEVEKARECGKPLKAVFEIVARLTGRKPNSIRNYYYARIKEDEARGKGAIHSCAFVPFTPDEVEMLLRRVLSDQAKGISVRACTLAMGNGDNKAMLRYQNKYRSLIKTNQKLVREIMDRMKSEGTLVFDPYKQQQGERKAGRPRKTPERLVDVVSTVVNDLDKVEGLDVTAFFESLGALAVGAGKGALAQRRLRELESGENGETLKYRELNDELKRRLDAQAIELDSQRERFAQLLSMFRQLMNVNREFLGMTSVVKVSSLSTYIRELSQNVENCEKLMIEYK